MKRTSEPSDDVVGTLWAPTVEPSGDDGHESALALSPPSAPNRTNKGTFAAGNSVARRHGGRSMKPLANPEQSELFVAWAADLGGINDLTAGQRAVLRRVAEADAVCQTAYTYLVRTREALTSERLQKALSVLATHAGTVYRGAALLGLERHARSVPTVAEWVAAQNAASTPSGSACAEPEVAR